MRKAPATHSGCFFCTQNERRLILITNQELNTLLYQKMFAEQESYRQHLLTLPPEEILDNAYEYTIREDILLSLEYNDLTNKQCQVLLKSEHLDTGNYSRDSNAFLAQCVGNILCQRNGIDGKSLAVTQLPQKYAKMEPKQLREKLKSIRTAANQISADMFRFLDAKSHGSRQRDDAR